MEIGHSMGHYMSFGTERLHPLVIVQECRHSCHRARHSKIENVQRHWTSNLLYPSLSNTSYSTRCQLKKLKFIWVRRQEAGFCLLFRRKNSSLLPSSLSLPPFIFLIT
uniref:Uncharacterized protein n=1 Tax=Schistocephalus solidus TaxID=70667 RepID=A0A0X3NUV8_SCHSO